jgi:hypothetical protein
VVGVRRGVAPLLGSFRPVVHIGSPHVAVPVGGWGGSAEAIATLRDGAPADLDTFVEVAARLGPLVQDPADSGLYIPDTSQTE